MKNVDSNADSHAAKDDVNDSSSVVLATTGENTSGEAYSSWRLALGCGDKKRSCMRGGQQTEAGGVS